MRSKLTDLEHSKMKALRSIETSGSTYSAMTTEFHNTGMPDYNAVKTSKTLTNKWNVKQPNRSSHNLTQRITIWISTTVFNPFQCHHAAMLGPLQQSRLPATVVHEKSTNNRALRKQPVNINSLSKRAHGRIGESVEFYPTSWERFGDKRYLRDKHWHGVHFWLTRRLLSDQTQSYRSSTIIFYLFVSLPLQPTVVVFFTAR